jgi:hypothetical protein
LIIDSDLVFDDSDATEPTTTATTTSNLSTTSDPYATSDPHATDPTATDPDVSDPGVSSTSPTSDTNALSYDTSDTTGFSGHGDTTDGTYPNAITDSDTLYALCCDSCQQFYDCQVQYDGLLFIVSLTAGVQCGLETIYSGVVHCNALSPPKGSHKK